MSTKSTILTAVIVLVLVGCNMPIHRSQIDKSADRGEVLPEWAFDAPHYFRPPPDAQPQPVNDPDVDYPQHYYVRHPVVLVTKPVNNVPIDRAPRVSIWWTSTNGCLWTRAGYFGLGQTHFAFVTGDEGDYGLRFVGPGITESLTEQTIPHRIYHFDVSPPVVSVAVQPDKALYLPNEVVWLHWSACDPNIDDMPVQVALCWSWENPDVLELRQGERIRPDSIDIDKNESRIWKPLKSVFESEGVLAYTIPDFAGGEGLQLQVRAKDKGGNYGVGYSKVIFVAGSTGDIDEQADQQAQGVPATQPAVSTTTQPADSGFEAAAAGPPAPPQPAAQPIKRERPVFTTDPSE